MSNVGDPAAGASSSHCEGLVRSLRHRQRGDLRHAAYCVADKQPREAVCGWPLRWCSTASTDPQHVRGRFVIMCRGSTATPSISSSTS